MMGKLGPALSGSQSERDTAYTLHITILTGQKGQRPLPTLLSKEPGETGITARAAITVFPILGTKVCSWSFTLCASPVQHVKLGALLSV